MADPDPTPPGCCPECGSVLDVLVEKDEAIRGLGEQVGYLRNQVRQLRTKQNQDVTASPFYDDAKQVFDHWKAKVMPRAREFSGARVEKVIARLRGGATVDELKLAVDGLALRPYVVSGKGRSATGSPDEKYIELGSSSGWCLCKDEGTVQKFMAYAEADAAEPKDPKSVGIPADKLQGWQRALVPVLDRLAELRGWDPRVMVNLGLGLDGDRVVFPIRDKRGRLVGVCRYAPNPEKRHGSKLVAQGARDLFPSPESQMTDSCWLVEGEPDAVSMRSIGLPGIAVPGVNTWKSGWAERFAKFDRVYVAFDCDENGRKAAEARCKQLGDLTHVIPVDLDPGRSDGYDVGDLIRAEGASAERKLQSLAVSTGGAVAPLVRSERPDRPFDVVTTELERHDCRVQHRAPGRAEAQCPVHADRVPSLSVSEADDGKVLLHCHAGCEVPQIAEALGIEMRELFAA